MEEEIESMQTIIDNVNGINDVTDQGGNRKDGSHLIKDDDRIDYEVQKTPTSQPIRCIGRSLSLPIQLSSWLSLRSDSDSRNSSPSYKSPSSTSSMNHPHSHRQVNPTTNKEAGASGVSVSGLTEELKEGRETRTLSGVLWREIEKQLKKLADPDMQLAGLI